MELDTERSLEQKHFSVVRGFYGRFRSIYDWIYARFGEEEGSRMIAEMSRSYGLQVAERAKKRIKRNDIRYVAGYLFRIFENVGAEASAASEVTPHRIVLTAHRCPLNFDKPSMCLAHTAFEQTVVATLGPNLIYRIGKSIPAGDSCCEHIIEVSDKVTSSTESRD